MDKIREFYKIDAVEKEINYVSNKSLYKKVLDSFKEHKQERLLFKIYDIPMDEWNEAKEVLTSSGATITHDYFINNGECLSVVIAIKESMLYEYRHFLNINLHAGKYVYFIALFVTLFINIQGMDEPKLLFYSFFVICLMIANMIILSKIIYKMNFKYNGFQTNFLDIYGDDVYWQGRVLKYRKDLIANITDAYIPVLVITSLFLIMSLAVN